MTELQDIDISLVDENQARFNAAVKASGELDERYFRIAGGVVHLRFASHAFAQAFSRAFAHLRSAPVESPDLRVFIWDGASSGVEALGIPSAETIAKLNDDPEFGQLLWNPSLSLNNDQLNLIYEAGTGALTVFAPQRGMAVYWIQDVNTIPSWIIGSPLRNLIFLWLNHRRILMVHGGAVGLAQGGVLFAGKGGSGKSSVSLRCLMSGFSFIGDDYVAVRLDGQPLVHSIYGSARTDFDNLHRFPGLESLVVNKPAKEGEKALLFPVEFAAHKVPESFPLRAILAPKITQQAETRLLPSTAAQSLASMAPSTLFQLHGERRGPFQMMSELVRSVPSFKLEIGRDTLNVPDLILGLLESGQVP